MAGYLKTAALAGGLIAASCGSVGATVQTISPTVGPLATNTTISKTFSFGGAGSGTLNFNILGYISLDGVNFYEDDLTVKLNGTTIFSGSFDLGGGGSNQLFSGNFGTTYSVTPVSTGNPTFAGGSLTVAEPILFASGTNTLDFIYTSLPAPGHAGFQGLGDEGWGLNSASVTSAVPEASTWAMMLLGLVGLGFLTRRPSRARMA